MIEEIVQMIERGEIEVEKRTYTKKRFSQDEKKKIGLENDSSLGLRKNRG